jgi:myosin protein heavy chain
MGALCKFMYERNFGRMVERINKALDRPSAKSLVALRTDAEIS